MQRVFSRGRTFLVLLLAGISIVIYLTLDQKPHSAQERPVELPKARFDQFSRADAVTSAIRDRSKEIVRVHFRTIGDREKAIRYGDVVEDFGSFMVLAKNRTTDMSRSGLDVQRIETTVNLPGPQFDPVDAPPRGTVRHGDAVRPGRGYYILQFGGIATDEWVDSIRDAGVEVLQYIPHQAFFVYGDASAIARVAGHSRVRWVGNYLPEQKLSAHVREFVRNSESEMATYDIAVFSRADLDEVAGTIGGRVISRSKLPNNFFNVLRVELPRADVERISATSDVFRIDPYVRPTAEDERAAQIVAGNYSSTTVLSPAGYNPLVQFGADGTGVTVMVSDDGISIPGNGGFYITAANTVDGPLRGATAGASGGHGHINASIIAGNTPFGILDPT